MSRHIHLGYSVPNGLPIEVPLMHTVVTGQTQQSGKTTTLEAMVSRSGFRALAFITKKHEGAFASGRTIQPYFRERADWQFVAAMLEATMREKFKYERPWIVQVCKGASSLAQVQRNVRDKMKTARGRNADVYVMLNEYLEIVLPVIEAIRWDDQISLGEGLNVMDLTEMATEVQSLVIGACLDWIYAHEKSTITILPEAWEFLPQGRASPVTLSAEQLIRKGAAAQNFVWLDSQDLAAVNKAVIKSVGLWILGVQREVNEVKRVLAHVGGAQKPTAFQIMDLDRGQFYACWRGNMHLTYVEPQWMKAAEAKAIAQRRLDLPEPSANVRKPLPVQKIRETAKASGDGLAKPKPLTHQPPPEDREMNKQEMSELSQILATSVASALAPMLNGLGARQSEFRESAGFPSSLDKPSSQPPYSAASADVESLYAQFRDRVLSDPQVLKVLSLKKTIEVVVEEQFIEADANEGYGMIAILIHDGFFDAEGSSGHGAFKELQRRGKSVAKPTVYRWCDQLSNMGFLTKEKSGNDTSYRAVADMKKNITKKRK